MSPSFSIPPDRIEEAKDIKVKYNLPIYIYEADSTADGSAGEHVFTCVLALWELAARLQVDLGFGQINGVVIRINPSVHPREPLCDMADGLKLTVSRTTLMRAGMLWDELGGKVAVATPAEPAPENNDGRTACYWCTGKVVPRGSYPYVYDVCVDCGK